MLSRNTDFDLLLAKVLKLDASDLSLRLHREVRAYEIALGKADKIKLGRTPRLTFPNDERFWRSVLGELRWKMRYDDAVKRVRSFGGPNNAKQKDLKVTYEFEHLKKKIDTFYNSSLTEHRNSDQLATPRSRQEEVLTLSTEDRDLDEGTVTLPELRMLPWQLLPRGAWSIDFVLSDLRMRLSTSKFRRRTFDENRLKKIVKILKPTHCYIGQDEFDGYIVFCFHNQERVILECPVYGNAIYIIKGDWKRVTKLSKGALLRNYPGKVARVIHRDSWMENLQHQLRYF